MSKKINEIERNYTFPTGADADTIRARKSQLLNQIRKSDNETVKSAYVDVNPCTLDNPAKEPGVTIIIGYYPPTGLLASFGNKEERIQNELRRIVLDNFPEASVCFNKEKQVKIASASSMETRR